VTLTCTLAFLSFDVLKSICNAAPYLAVVAYEFVWQLFQTFISSCHTQLCHVLVAVVSCHCTADVEFNCYVFFCERRCFFDIQKGLTTLYCTLRILWRLRMTTKPPCIIRSNVWCLSVCCRVRCVQRIRSSQLTFCWKILKAVSVMVLKLTCNKMLACFVL